MKETVLVFVRSSSSRQEESVVVVGDQFRGVVSCDGEISTLAVRSGERARASMDLRYLKVISRFVLEKERGMFK